MEFRCAICGRMRLTPHLHSPAWARGRQVCRNVLHCWVDGINRVHLRQHEIDERLEKR